MDHTDGQLYYKLQHAIVIMANHADGTPTLDELAEATRLEAGDFFELFTEWAGVEPDTFARTLQVQLKKKGNPGTPDLFDTAPERKSATPKIRFDQFLAISRVKTDELTIDGDHPPIMYSVHPSPFGRMMVASTQAVVCRVSFLSEDDEAGVLLKGEFADAVIRHEAKAAHRALANYFETPGSDEVGRIDCQLLRGTPFQFSVWKALLQIPEGELVCCADIAKKIGNPKAVRAVGSAVGSNPVAYFIPCHRVIPAAGGFGNYRWGKTRKMAMIGWEAARSY